MPETAQFRHGAGRLCLDFVRTLRFRGRPEVEEELPDLEALATWVGEFGPVEVATVDRAAEGGQVGEAQRLREAVFELVEAARAPAGVRACPVGSVELVNRAAARPVPAPRLVAQGGVSWQADDPVAATLSLIARDALDLASSGAIGRVRNCADPSCRALFYDGSRPGSRRWCSMDACGNRAKKATLRAKSD
jgi:predicted RNA-binding Zn ribbon-like protein